MKRGSEYNEDFDEMIEVLDRISDRMKVARKSNAYQTVKVGDLIEIESGLQHVLILMGEISR